MNVVDAAQPSQALAITAVAKALAAGQQGSVRPGRGRVRRYPLRQGRAAAARVGMSQGSWLSETFLLPVPSLAPWTATEIELPKEEFKGSQCEKSVNWATVSAKSKSSRVYLIPDSGTKFFGLNEIVLTTKDAKAAAKHGRQAQIRPDEMREDCSSPQLSPSRRK